MKSLTRICLLFVSLLTTTAFSAEPSLIGHWPLQVDAEDHSSSHLSTSARDIDFEIAGPNSALQKAARFNGRSSILEIADTEKLRLGTSDFSICMFVNADAATDDIPGDLLSHYDPTQRTGFHLGLYTHGGVTSAQPNTRQLHFGIDHGQLEQQFTDHGQLGNAVFVFALCVHNGKLYAATCHAGPEERGHVYRFDENAANPWTDLGSPDQANSISAMCVFDGALYVASSKYRLGGSALAESQNPNFGGKVFRLTENDRWVSCGTLSEETQAIGSLVVFRDQLYASSLYAPAGFFRYEGGEKWTACATPNGKRVEALCVFNGAIYATCYDEGSVFRFDGQAWQQVGSIPEATQTYGFAIHRGELYVSEWPKARVFRYTGDTNWVDAGKLGQELEAMPLLVYNGKMYGGTLPLAEVYRYDGDHNWLRIGRVDQTPDVKYRRAWSMAVFQGRLFVGTLPGGRVLSIEAGRNATWDYPWTKGWHHVAAVRNDNRLQLYVDGNLVAQSAPMRASDYDLNNSQPLRIGFGAQDFFCGAMADVRLYQGALSSDQIRELTQF